MANFNKLISKKKPRKTAEQIQFGNEPKFVGDISSLEMTKAFNWYNEQYDHVKGKKWILDYLKKSGRSAQLIKDIRNAPDWRTSTTACWMARMMLNGTTFPADMMTRFEARIQENALHGIKTETPKETTNVISIQDRVRKATDRLLSDAESEVIDDRKSMYEFLQANQVSQAAAKKFLDHYQPIYDEIMSDDEQVKEAYGKKLKAERTFMQTLIDDLNRYIGNKKVVKVRKPRERKQKSAIDLVKNLKYMKEFAPLKIVSVDPTNIIGASQLWTYNTKYKKLTRYDSVGPNGIQVKGTTLIGYDVETSLSKSLRKPDITIQSLLTAGKVALRSIMSDLKTNETKPNGRINPETILLKVIK
jgi:hypothetical protein